jgi:hypothetical protein
MLHRLRVGHQTSRRPHKAAFSQSSMVTFDPFGAGRSSARAKLAKACFGDLEALPDRGLDMLGRLRSKAGAQNRDALFFLPDEAIP